MKLISEPLKRTVLYVINDFLGFDMCYLIPLGFDPFPITMW